MRYKEIKKLNDNSIFRYDRFKIILRQDITLDN